MDSNVVGYFFISIFNDGFVLLLHKISAFFKNVFQFFNVFFVLIEDCICFNISFKSSKYSEKFPKLERASIE